MKVYNKEGQSMNADKDQMQILTDAGWSTIKPEPVVEPVVAEPVVEPVVAEPVVEEELEEGDEPIPVKPATIKAIPKVKKSVRKIPTKA